MSLSIWMLVFLTAVLQNSGAYGENDPKTIGDKVDVIIKDMRDYLYWLFGYGDDSSIESQIEDPEKITEDIFKEVNEMVEFMHTEAEKYIKHPKDIKRKENEESSSSSSSAEEKSTKSKEKNDLEVLSLSM